MPSTSTSAAITKTRRTGSRSHRRGVAAGVAVAAGTLLTGLVLRGLREAYQLTVERPVAEVPDLPEAWRGQRIALITDMHLGLAGANRVVAQEAVARALEARPAAVLFGGDFVHGSISALDQVEEVLRPLAQSGIQTYAVLGNHDYAMRTTENEPDIELVSELVERLRTLGIRVLENEKVELTLPESPETLTLVGLGAHAPGRDDAREVLSSVPEGEARIVLMHHPASFADLPAGAAPIAFAGHTHGGQVRLPLAPLMRYITYVKETQVVVAGWIRSDKMDGFGSPGNDLYITRGVGCSTVPIRLSCPPELTLFRLEQAG